MPAAASGRLGLSKNWTKQPSSPWLCCYDFQVLSARAAEAIFVQFVFDDLACTECSQARSLNIRNVHKDVPFGYADFAFRHNKTETFFCIEKLHHAARHVSPKQPIYSPRRFASRFCMNLTNAIPPNRHKTTNMTKLFVGVGTFSGKPCIDASSAPGEFGALT